MHWVKKIHSGKKWFILCSAVMIVLAACDVAPAQYRGVRRRRPSFSDQPTLSPYLGLLNQSNDVGQNYVGLVAPLVQQQESSARNAIAIRSLQRTVDSGGESSAYGAAKGIGQTGHGVTYMNFSHYYGGSGGGGGGGGGRAPRRSKGTSATPAIGGMGGIGMY
jgi:hypothetical protein